MSVSQQMTYQRFEAGHGGPTSGHVVCEELVRLHVNGFELATLMCTPDDLDLLALGMLRSEGFIRTMADVRRVVVCPSRTCVEVWLHDGRFEPPTRRIVTSGCGGGITFADQTVGVEPLQSDLRVTPRQLGRLMSQLQDGQETRGIHTSALASPEELLVIAEDVGRHNTIDKLIGRCLVEGIPTSDRILVCTGRISSEMLHKAARAGIPLIASRTSPTTLSVALATAWHVTLVGYVRRDSLNVYTGFERVSDDAVAG